MMMESPKREPSQTPPVTFIPGMNGINGMNGFSFPSSVASSPVKDEMIDVSYQDISTFNFWSGRAREQKVLRLVWDTPTYTYYALHMYDFSSSSYNIICRKSVETILYTVYVWLWCTWQSSFNSYPQFLDMYTCQGPFWMQFCRIPVYIPLSGYSSFYGVSRSCIHIVVVCTYPRPMLNM